MFHQIRLGRGSRPFGLQRNRRSRLEGVGLSHHMWGKENPEPPTKERAPRAAEYIMPQTTSQITLSTLTSLKIWLSVPMTEVRVQTTNFMGSTRSNLGTLAHKHKFSATSLQSLQKKREKRTSMPARKAKNANGHGRFEDFPHLESSPLLSQSDSSISDQSDSDDKWDEFGGNDWGKGAVSNKKRRCPPPAGYWIGKGAEPAHVGKISGSREKFADQKLKALEDVRRIEVQCPGRIATARYATSHILMGFQLREVRRLWCNLDLARAKGRQF
ncbi:uncharacterized protein LOC131889277 [Tigriopus californicus]|uniref:uncharacterized protein LOC131889277 n=1 Tax=Tigriopus californicus TaxID=6832 RepID=UPI0027DA298D|nr:uncharacterized protein LOC131889277 [Tigriopus californicus]